MSNPPAAGWYTDPSSRFTYRYWNGAQWTDQVSSEGKTATDAVDASFANVSPAPGSAAPGQSPAPASTVQVTTKSGGGSLFGVFLAAVLVIVLIVLIVALLVSDSDGDTSTTTPDAPAITEAPATTAGS